MAIGFARLEFVKRSSGKTVCSKSAYNSKSKIEFEGNATLSPQTFDWSYKGVSFFHKVLLPSGAHEKFQSAQALWNAVEAKETRINSQVAMEVVLALPDDKAIDLNDRIKLTESFAKIHFIDKGLAAQIDIHAPERKIQITRDNREIGLFEGMCGDILKEDPENLTIRFEGSKEISFNPREFNGFVERDNNWHAHILITTRRFKANGLEFEDHKARDLVPRVNKGKVIFGPDWGKLWTDHQNRYFEEKGLNLKVDSPGLQPQEHLGPVRMRGRAFDLLQEHSRRLEENIERSKNPTEILKKLTERLSVFTKGDVEHFLQKHVPHESLSEVQEAFWRQKDLVPLVDKDTGELTSNYTSRLVLDEEKKILRVADRISSKEAIQIEVKNAIEAAEALNTEQKQAFNSIILGKKLACLQGYAGTGKSHLLAALRQAYQASGYQVRAFGPDTATADVLKEKGFSSAENVYKFLFSYHSGKRTIATSKEVWILDEAGKIGNRPLLELLKAAEKKDVKVILSGDSAQMPSVERGGMFKIFCERYKSCVLQEIQRQQVEKQREIAKNLAAGEFGAAIDKLNATSRLRWSQTKREAVEELISTWAADTRCSPKPSTLLIAHTNDEVRLLNEMVRIVRKTRGELSEKEFLCDTFLGKVYLSEGDRIEFRKKDEKIGVTNGLFGTIVHAEADKFVVSVEKGKKEIQTITFNPQEYYSYQLGYASTYFRSQGKTIDKAYVLHSQFLNRPMFYVGLTRHVKEAFYFVSRDQVYCLADLKRQASRNSSKESAVSFTTLDEIQERDHNLQKAKDLSRLKTSDSFLDRLKGYGISAVLAVKEVTSSFKERLEDRRPSEEFFNPKISDQKTIAAVKEIIKAAEEETPSQLLKTILSHDSSLDKQEKSFSNVGKTRPFVNPEEFFAKRQEIKKQVWSSFGFEKQESFRQYFSLADEAQQLREIVEIEKESSDKVIGSVEHAKEWKNACEARDQSAHKLANEVTTDNLCDFLGKKSAALIADQSARHEERQQRKVATKGTHIEEELLTHIEPLVHRLFPDGPSRKERTAWRFGNKGSLSIEITGKEAGKYFDFESQEGGGLLKLVQQKLGLGRLEAIEWAKEFVGTAPELQIPKTSLSPSEKAVIDPEWVPLKPEPNFPAPKLEELSKQKLCRYFTEAARHEYRDELGDLLYYRLRLTDKTCPSKKITPPLSFGYWKSKPEEKCWELKGFDRGKSVLYNLHLLKKNPYSTVLIVEGEKTADKALDKFPGEDLICMTWSGGAGAAKRANWAPLIGRNVIIWPDNDKTGFQAGEDVCRELRKVGISSLRLVGSEELSARFLEKWDLADPLPLDIKPDAVKSILLSSWHKGINPEQVISRVSSSFKNDTIDKLRVNEILWRVDERLRPELEKRLSGQFWKVNNAILTETARILLRNKEWEPQLRYQVGKNSVSQISWQVMVFEAQYGRDPSNRELDKIKEVLMQANRMQISKHNRTEELGFDKAVSFICEKHLAGQPVTKEDLQKATLSMTQEAKTRSDSLKDLSLGFAQQKSQQEVTI